MRKSTKVKKTKVSKPVASTKKLKKFTNGGGNDIGTLKPKTPLEAAQSLKINPTIATAETLEQQKSSSENLMKGLMRPPAKEKETVVTAPKLESKTPVKSPKAKLLPGGFTSEAQRKAYTESLRQKIKSGKSVDQLVKEGYGTKKGLSDLGLGKYSEGLDLKKKGQAKKAEGLVSKSEGLRQKGIGIAVKGKGLRNKAIGKNEDLRPSKSKLTETEKNAIAKYKANPKNQKTLKLDSKKLNKKLAQQNEDTYRPNIVGDFIGGPLKAAATAVGVGAGLYGLYKAGKFAKNLSNVGKAFTKSVATKAAKAGGSQVAANAARKARSVKMSEIFSKVKNAKGPNKILGKVNADKLKYRSQVNRTQKGGLEKLLNPSTKTPKIKINKTSLKWNANRLQARSRVNKAQKEALGLMLKLKGGGKVTKMKKNGNNS